MKIIYGKYKGKKLYYSRKINFRPTTGRIKEAIFSMLSSGKYKDSNFIENAVVIDLFAGSGAYSFESLSRGAIRSIIVEIDPNNISIIKHNMQNIDPNADITVIRGDSTNLPKSKVKCNLAFIDPPYNSNLIFKTLNSLKNQEWLDDNSIVIVESSLKEVFSLPNGFKKIEQKEYGNTKIVMLEYNIND